VNYRVRNEYYLVDRVFDAAELRIGQKSQDIVRITRK
jgi:type IV secretion system protein VirB9